MTRRIEVLPESVSQKIAAGEVVERPSSVVKELVENAIDAHAKEIEVELRAGGLELIRVVDDGEGIEPEDLSIAIQRFATSKIRKVEDLYAIHTLGFRGEALPSIASVSHMIITSRVPHHLSGRRMILEGGEVKSLSEIGCPIGTEIQVRNLFYNLPVKRKFLKSIRSEFRLSLNQLFRISLSFPSISFKFIHDDRIVQELLRSESLWVRVEALFGKEILNHLQEIESEEKGIHLSGLISLPPFSKGNAEGLYLYVNRRYVKDRIIYKAILEAYQHCLPSRKFPFCLLFLKLPPSSIDVNVHPTKIEVKFREPEKVYQLVFSTLRHILEGGKPSPSNFRERREEAQGLSFFRRDIIEPPKRMENEPSLLTIKEERPLWQEEREKRFRVIGQIWETYILCETDENFIVIDQHAAHERILYDKWKKEVENHSIRSQPMLIPILFDCTHEESLILEDALEAFHNLGFELEAVGERLYAIRAIPSLIGPEYSEQWIKEILEELSLLKKGGEGGHLVQTLLISLSCHSAVRGRRVMRKEEMEELVNALYPLEATLVCPHGRPICYLIPRSYLERQFKRKHEGS
ncbi:MAG: DNA mismatch repair endonuclease MutL [Thermodesulfobacteriota bacterium]